MQGLFFVLSVVGISFLRGPSTRRGTTAIYRGGNPVSGLKLIFIVMDAGMNGYLSESVAIEAAQKKLGKALGQEYASDEVGV